MAITPSDLLQQAQTTPRGTELLDRLSINRAYYAVFHNADSFHKGLASLGRLPPRACGVHETLFHQLVNPTNSGDPKSVTSKRLGLIGRDLRKYRKKADYDLSETVSVDEVEYVIAQSEKVASLVFDSSVT